MALHLIRNNLTSTNVALLARYSHNAAHNFSHALQSAQNATVTELDNGIRVATEKTNSPVTTVGVWTDSGSQSESKELNGINHFIEHLLFKGSKKCNKKQLENDVYGLGAVFNSFSNRTSNGFLATVSPSDANKAIEILSDLIQDPALDSSDIESERKNILQELENIESNCEEVIMDYLHSVAYQGCSLAYSKYGPTENIKRFTQDDIKTALDLYFKGPGMVIAASGDVDHDKLVKQVGQSMKGISSTYESAGVPSFATARFTGSDIRVRDDSLNCAHVAIAIEGPGYSNPDFVAMDIAYSLFGKWDLTHGGGINVSSYMGMVSASEHLAQSFQSFNLAYQDTALWGSYFVGERMKLEELLWQLQYQWKRLCLEVTNNEIRQGKNTLLTNLVCQREGSVNNANSIASDVLKFGRRVSLEDWARKINEVDANKIHSVAQNYIWDRCPAVAAIGPVENLPNYEEIRMKMSWIRY